MRLFYSAPLYRRLLADYEEQIAAAADAEAEAELFRTSLGRAPLPCQGAARAGVVAL